MEQFAKKFIVIGAMDGVPSEAISMALRERGYEVVFCINQFFVWMTAGAMDLDDQWKLAKVIEEYGTDNLFVLLGCPDAESSQIQAETVSTGDPSMVGPLTDRSFHLQVAHVAEPAVKKILSPKIFDRCIQQFLSRVDVAAIAQRMNEVRARQPG